MSVKKDKGISLIALVVTIIVLMILAGISIQMLRGDTGIINQTHNANQIKNVSEEKEAVEWAAAQATGDEDNKTGTLTSNNGKNLIDKYLKQYIGEETDSSNQFEYTIYEPGEEVEGENVDLTKDEFIVKFKESENIYIIDQNGVVHKDPTSGNNNNKNNGNGNGNQNGNQGSESDKNTEITKRDGVILDQGSMDVNNETTNTINITTNASNLKITNSDDSVIELIEKSDEKIKFVAKKIGRSTITVETEKGKKARCYVLVHQEPKNIVLDTTNITFDLSNSNKQYQVTATIEPSTTNRDTDITWTSSNSNVAEVSSSGNPDGQLKSIGTITAKSNGTAVITASTKNGTKATCQVTVHTSPTKITLNKNNILLDISGLNARKEETLKVTYTPSTSDIKKKITWTSSDPNVAIISPSGTFNETATIKSKASGRTTIIAKTENGFLAQCEVVVQSSITKITLSRTSATLDLAEIEAKKVIQLSATITPSIVTEGYTWTSSNTTVATVSNSGYVTGKKDGTVTITAKSSSGKTSATCTITVKTSVMVQSGSTRSSYSLEGGYSSTTCHEYEKHCVQGDCISWDRTCVDWDEDLLGAAKCHFWDQKCTGYGPDKCHDDCVDEEDIWHSGYTTISFNLNTSIDTSKLKLSWSGSSSVSIGSLSRSGTRYTFTLYNDSTSYAKGTVTLIYKDSNKTLYTWTIK